MPGFGMLMMGTWCMVSLLAAAARGTPTRRFRLPVDVGFFDDGEAEDAARTFGLSKEINFSQ
jgi:hypothetical protein